MQTFASSERCCSLPISSFVNFIYAKSCLSHSDLTWDGVHRQPDRVGVVGDGLEGGVKSMLQVGVADRVQISSVFHTCPKKSAQIFFHDGQFGSGPFVFSFFCVPILSDRTKKAVVQAKQASLFNLSSHIIPSSSPTSFFSFVDFSGEKNLQQKLV